MIDDHNADGDSGVFHDHGAERAVIGAMLVSREQIAEVEPIVAAADFHHPVNQLLFRELMALREADQPTDPTTLVGRLAQTGQIRKVPENGMYVHSVYAASPAATSASHFARIVADRSMLRSLDEGLQRVRTAIRTGAGSSADLVEQAREMVAALGERAVGSAGGYVAWDDIAADRIAIHDRRRQGEEVERAPIPTGFPDLDKLLNGGLKRRELCIIAGRPGEGKTTLAGDIIREVAFHQWLPVGFVSLEMPREAIFDRLICAEAGVNADQVESGFADSFSWQAINSVSEELKGAPLFCDDTRGQTFADIRLRAKRLKQRHDIQVLIVDYLGLVEVRDNRPRHQQVDELAKRLLHLADELDVAVVLLAQLNRNASTRADKRPILTDLKESGGIESHANVVIFVHQPSRHKEGDRPGEADLIVAKNRAGREEDVPVAAQLHLNRFYSMAY